MSRSRRASGARLACCACLGLLAGIAVATAQEANEPSGHATVYVRTDSDTTTIITPTLHLGTPLGESTRADLTYTVDVWTSASVDIVTAATGRVTEQRDELNVGLSHDFGAVSVNGGYRYSVEYDYESHGGSLGTSWDFADNNATLALGAYATFDQVWAAGREALKQPASTIGARGSFTQVFDPNTLGQVVYELGVQSGYLSSPYRYVRIADDAGVVPGTCAYPVTSCLPENNPDSRLRNAIALVVRRALGEHLSLGGTYRFYFDDWELNSHTVEASLGYMPTPTWLFDVAYRFYIQNSAAHYKPYYPNMGLPAVYTSDKELSALRSHRLGGEITHLWDLDDAGTRLRAVLLFGPTFYSYSEFPLRDRITAFEATLSAGVEL